jgi:hypothetical protein
MIPVGVRVYKCSSSVCVRMHARLLSLSLCVCADVVAGAGAVMQTASGFFLVPNTIPPWVIWVYYASYLKYALEGLYWNQFAETTLPSVGTLLTQYFYVDQNLNRWTNLVVLMWYPPLLHVIAAAVLAWQGRRRVVVSPGP